MFTKEQVPIEKDSGDISDPLPERLKPLAARPFLGGFTKHASQLQPAGHSVLHIQRHANLDTGAFSNTIGVKLAMALLNKLCKILRKTLLRLKK
ncbi:hypothetical protein Cadr_000030043 [Camelus dromedarius]|uniref:Uncharacterized protein n=1 Tax=Camelus dromedarius TaxID=9838 RepID=A0A5N4CD31_CAMDR|nr:hypothetical protein Cadr_000030043 [Camelus dromedarius]